MCTNLVRKEGETESIISVKLVMLGREDVQILLNFILHFVTFLTICFNIENDPMYVCLSHYVSMLKSNQVNLCLIMFQCWKVKSDPMCVTRFLNILT